MEELIKKLLEDETSREKLFEALKDFKEATNNDLMTEEEFGNMTRFDSYLCLKEYIESFLAYSKEDQPMKKLLYGRKIEHLCKLLAGSSVFDLQ